MKKKRKKIKENTKEILIKISIIIFPILVGMSFLFHTAFNYEIKNSKHDILSRFSGKIDVFEAAIQSLFQEVFEDIFIIANSDEFSNYTSIQSPETELEVKELFKRYMKNKESYLQLRVLDIAGNEIIRVDRVNNDVFIFPNEKLQSKKDRYYFKEGWCVMSSAPLYSIPENLICCKIV